MAKSFILLALFGLTALSAYASEEQILNNKNLMITSSSDPTGFVGCLRDQIFLQQNLSGVVSLISIYEINGRNPSEAGIELLLQKTKEETKFYRLDLMLKTLDTEKGWQLDQFNEQVYSKSTAVSSVGILLDQKTQSEIAKLDLTACKVENAFSKPFLPTPF